MKLLVRKKPPVTPVSLSEIGGKEILHNVRPENRVSIDDLLCAAEKMQRRCTDDVVKVKYCEVMDAPETSNFKFTFAAENPDDGWEAVMTDYSLAQFGFRYGIPSSYIKRCTLAKMKDLVCENFNRWIDYDEGSLLVRRYDDGENYVRGILSTRYARYDTDLILRDVANSRICNWEIRQYLLSPERFHLRLVSDEKLNVAGEDLEIALNVDSSDIGRNSLNLQVIIFRQICSNGMILPYSVGNLYRQVHKGVGAEKFPDRIAAALQSVPEIKRKAEEMINRTMGTRLPFDVDNEDAVTRFRQSFGVPKDFVKKVIEMYKQGNDEKNARWNFINCMTEIAQGYGIDTRLDLERAAGNLLIAA